MTLAELRAAWRTMPDPGSRELLLEIARLHNVLVQAEDMRKIIQTAWSESCKGHLSALHSLRKLLSEEVAVMDRKLSGMGRPEP